MTNKVSMKNKELINKIKELKSQTGIMILAHNYQIVEIQEVADFRGDSLQLSMRAAEAKASTIVFCGVHFMAETAAILNPGARILLPAIDAGCPMADMITHEQLVDFKAAHPGSPVVCYVNSTAEVKAESDICCTSSNAVKVLQSLPADKPILFVPDMNLGHWAGQQAKREVIVWHGYCPIHQWGFNEAEVLELKAKYPQHKLLVHPECDESVVQHADEVMSTGGMMKWMQENDNAIIATELGLVNYLQYLYPAKSIIPMATRAVCKNMKKITLESVYNSLLHQQYEINVPEAIAQKALGSITRMLDISR